MGMVQMELKQSIHEYLKVNCFGRQKAAKADFLANGFNISLRDINEAVRQLRKDGYLIGSSKGAPSGYYIPATEEEVKNYLDTFKSELFDMLSTFNRQKRAKHAYIENLRTKDLFGYDYDKAGQMELKLTR